VENIGVETLTKVFLEKNGKRLITGFGLGLPIVKHLFQPLETQQTTLLPKTLLSYLSCNQIWLDLHVDGCQCGNTKKMKKNPPNVRGHEHLICCLRSY
jgi:hypothetical protein